MEAIGNVVTILGGIEVVVMPGKEVDSIEIDGVVDVEVVGVMVDEGLVDIWSIAVEGLVDGMAEDELSGILVELDSTFVEVLA